MGSTRLAGKVLADIESRPLLWHVVERMKSAKTLEKVIVATTDRPEDDAIDNLAKKEGWLLYRGSSEDVLDRYYQAAKKFNLGVIVRVVGDCPLIDPLVVDICVEKFFEDDCDFISNFFNDESTFPRGLDVRVFSFKALEKSHQKAMMPYEREHVAPYIFENRNNEFKIGPTVKAGKDYAGNYRFTVDYPEDLLLIKNIYQKFYAPGKIISAREVIAFLNKNPEFAKVNAEVIQKPYKAS